MGERLRGKRWRVGRKAGRTVYVQVGAEPSDDDRLIGVLDTPSLAEEAVRAHNALVERPDREALIERLRYRASVCREMADDAEGADQPGGATHRATAAALDEAVDTVAGAAPEGLPAKASEGAREAGTRAAARYRVPAQLAAVPSVYDRELAERVISAAYRCDGGARIDASTGERPEPLPEDERRALVALERWADDAEDPERPTKPAPLRRFFDRLGRGEVYVSAGERDASRGHSDGQNSPQSQAGSGGSGDMERDASPPEPERLRGIVETAIGELSDPEHRDSLAVLVEHVDDFIESARPALAVSPPDQQGEGEREAGIEELERRARAEMGEPDDSPDPLARLIRNYRTVFGEAKDQHARAQRAERELAEARAEVERVTGELDDVRRQFKGAGALFDQRTAELDALREWCKEQGHLPDDLPSPTSFDRELRDRLPAAKPLSTDLLRDPSDELTAAATGAIARAAPGLNRDAPEIVDAVVGVFDAVLAHQEEARDG